MRFGSLPTVTEWDCRPHLDPGQGMERCALPVPGEHDRAWIMVRGRSETPSEYTLRVSYDGVDGVAP